MTEPLYLCTICRTRQPASHFTCGAGAKGGKARGPSKARGDREWYQRLSKAAVAAKKQKP